MTGLTAGCFCLHNMNCKFTSCIYEEMFMSRETSGIVTPFEGIGHFEWEDDQDVPAPLQLYTTAVPGEWVDYNHHMSESSFLLAFGNNSDAFFRFIGIDESYREGGHSLFTVETHIHNVAQARQGDRLALSLSVLDIDTKRAHIMHIMTNLDTGEEVAIGEQLLVHVDTDIGRSSELPAHLYERLSRIQSAHATLARPSFIGRPLGVRRK